MIVSTLLSLLAGAVLGMRFKVLILLPAAAVASAAILLIGFAASQPLGRTILVAATAVVALQVGYLCGVAIKYALVVSNVHSLRNHSRPASTAPRPIAR